MKSFISIIVAMSMVFIIGCASAEHKPMKEITEEEHTESLNKLTSDETEKRRVFIAQVCAGTLLAIAEINGELEDHLSMSVHYQAASAFASTLAETPVNKAVVYDVYNRAMMLFNTGTEENHRIIIEMANACYNEMH